jgi:hypothetical protein
MTAPDAPLPDSPPPPASSKMANIKRKAKRVLVLLIILPILLVSLWTLLVLKWSFSDGYRAGILQKFSRKGFVCKTWEGEIQQSVVTGVAPVFWQFTVRDRRIGEQLSTMLGQKVSLHYHEHIGVPTTCFGETGYYVDSVNIIHDQ